jgi:hypothetical protein
MTGVLASVRSHSFIDPNFPHFSVRRPQYILSDTASRFLKAYLLQALVPISL